MRTRVKKVRRFAEGTSTPVERTKSEIEKLVREHGATEFASSWDKAQYTVMFQIRGKRLRFDIKAPSASEYTSTKAWEAEERRRWRALLLILKAKLEFVHSGDVEFENEFLAQFVLLGGRTIGGTFVPKLKQVLSMGDGQITKMLGPGNAGTE